VVGWALAEQMRAARVTQALSMALSPRQPAAGRILHTARGRQYGADSYRQRLTQHGLQPRMSRTGTCGDNAVAESVCHTLQTALISTEDYDTHEATQTAVGEYIEGFSNRQHGHAAHGSLAPLADEQA
jgi:putative transposase